MLYDWGSLVTLPELENLVLAQRTGKATGHDGISTELLRLHAPSSARRLYPLLAKTTLSLREPVAYKGGSLLVQAAAAFVLYSLLAHRPNSTTRLCETLVPGLLQLRQELQAGAVPGTGVEALSLLVRSFQDQAHASKRQWEAICFDIRSAFYRVIRQLVLPVPESHEAICRLIKTYWASLSRRVEPSCVALERRPARDVFQDGQG